MAAPDGNIIYTRITMNRGLALELLGQTTTTLFKPENTVDENKVQAAKLVQWLRDTADEWEQDFAREFSNTDAS